MKFKEMVAENLYSYKKLLFNFIYSGGVTLVISKNLDQKTANGGGKTSILKILFFGLYGTDLNKAVKADIPNRNGNGSFYFSINIEDLGHELRIERFSKRKDLHPLKVDKECLNLYVDGVLLMGAATGHDPDVVQQTIIDRLRLSPRLFLSSVLTKQNNFKGNSIDFLRANDTQKKDILAEILDLTSYVRAHEATKKEISAIEDRRKDKQNRVDSLNEQIKLLEEQIKEQEILFASFDDLKAQDVLKEENNLKVERNKIIQLRKTIKKLEDPVVLSDNLLKLNKEISSLEAVLKDEVSVIKSLTEKKSELEQKQLSLNDLINNINLSKIELDKKYDHLIKVDNYDLLSIEDFESIQINNLSLVGETITRLDIERKALTDKTNQENELKNQLQQVTTDISTKDKEINRINFTIDSLNKQSHELEVTDKCPTCERNFDAKHREEHIVPKINEFQKELANLKSQVKLLIEEKDAIINNSLNKLNEQLSSLDSHKKLAAKYGQMINYLKNVQDEHTKFLDNQKRLSDNLIINNEKVNELKNLIDSLSKDIEPIQKQSDEMIPLKNELINNQQNKKDLETKISNIKEQTLINKQISDKITLITENGMTLAENLKKLKDKTNPHKDIINGNRTKIKSIEDNIDKFQKSINDDDNELKYLKFWLLGFSPTGIRSFISDDLIDILNQKVASHLDDLFDGALSVLFEPESENNKGVSINKIQTKYFLNGKEVSEESLSGGQIQRCILATDLALTEVAESRSGTKLNVKFLDEPFTGMDSAGQQQAFRLFNKLAKEKDGFFVISHDENFQSLCANTVHILYKNETSEIVSKDEFNQYSVGDEQDLNENVFENKKDFNFKEYLKKVAQKKK